MGGGFKERLSGSHPLHPHTHYTHPIHTLHPDPLHTPTVERVDQQPPPLLRRVGRVEDRHLPARRQPLHHVGQRRVQRPVPRDQARLVAGVEEVGVLALGLALLAAAVVADVEVGGLVAEPVEVVLDCVVFFGVY